jgi:hypothetical protein
MDPINPWLDSAEVRRLAERLVRPVLNPAVTVRDAGFNAGFVGYAASTPPAAPTADSSPPASRVHPDESKPQSGSAVTPDSGGAVFQAPAETVTTTARGPFLDRIHRFRDWMRQYFSASGIFILDRDGAVIFDESRHGRMHFLARSLAMASRRQGTIGNNVHVKIGAGATLEVIPVETPYGCLVLGALVPEALPPSAVSAVMEALVLVATPPDQPAARQSGMEC